MPTQQQRREAGAVKKQITRQLAMILRFQRRIIPIVRRLNAPAVIDHLPDHLLFCTDLLPDLSDLPCILLVGLVVHGGV